MKLQSSWIAASVLGAAILAAAPCSPAAAAWPERAVTITVPFAPGGSTDTAGRVIAQKLNEKFGVPFIVENRPGATGAIGASAVARAEPDGYSLLVASIGIYATNPYLQPKLPYDPLKDFDLLSVLVSSPNVLVVNPKSPAKSVADLIELCKKNPGKLSFASSGAGSSDHLTAVMFWQMTGTSGVHVPYRGGALAIGDLVAGHVDVSFQNLNAVINQIRAGNLRALGITTTKRSPLLPDVPTMIEAGFKDLVVTSWQAAAAPKGLPADVKAKLHAAIVEGMRAPDVRAKFEDIGFEIIANTPEEFRTFLVNELAKWKKVIETGKVQLD